MFTGIIQHVGTVEAIRKGEAAQRLVLDAASWGISPAMGESIAVNGVCLTVAAIEPPCRLHFDVVTQTLAVTAIDRLRPGSRVNLERAVTASTILGGHIVQGHVDGVGVVERADEQPGQRLVRISVPAELGDCIVEKGSVAVDGVSLTVAGSGDGWFEVALIPVTLRETTLGEIAAGDRVNIETDYIAKTVVHWLRRRHEA